MNQPSVLLPTPISDMLAEPLANALEALCDAAFHHDISLYLVGGVVRDGLLVSSSSGAGAPTLDLDLAFDGDPTPLHSLLSDLSGGPPTVHDRFGTSSVHLSGYSAARIDLARTRTERYAVPGALPDVEPAPILEDLRRRDFTVNAAAFVLCGPDAGALLDPFGGAGDMRDGMIRTIHARSFADDPTRLIRAARYSARLDARLSRRTSAEARNERHHLAALSAGRFGDAWRLLLREPNPGAAVRAGLRMQLPQSRWPAWRVAPRVASVSASPERFWAGVGLTERSRPVINDLPDRVALKRGERAALDDGARLRSLRQRLGSTRRASAVASLIGSADRTALEVSTELWHGASARSVRDYLDRHRAIAAPISATRLLELGVPHGPAIGDWQRWLSDAVWDDLLDPEDSLAVARVEQRIASNPDWPPRPRRRARAGQTERR